MLFSRARQPRPSRTRNRCTVPLEAPLLETPCAPRALFGKFEVDLIRLVHFHAMRFIRAVMLLHVIIIFHPGSYICHRLMRFVHHISFIVRTSLRHGNSRRTLITKYIRQLCSEITILYINRDVNTSSFTPLIGIHLFIYLFSKICHFNILQIKPTCCFSFCGSTIGLF